MDHKEQHHLHHSKEREQEKKRKTEHELEEERSPWKIHPGWFLGLGVVLMLLVLAVWTFFL